MELYLRLNCQCTIKFMSSTDYFMHHFFLMEPSSHKELYLKRQICSQISALVGVVEGFLSFALRFPALGS